MIFSEGEEMLYGDLKVFLEEEGWEHNNEDSGNDNIYFTSFFKKNEEYYMEICFADDICDSPESDSWRTVNDVPKEISSKFKIESINILNTPFSYSFGEIVNANSYTNACYLCSKNLHMLPELLSYLNDQYGHAEKLIKSHLKNLNETKGIRGIMSDNGWVLINSNMLSSLSENESHFRFSLEYVIPNHWGSGILFYTDILTMNPFIVIDGEVLDISKNSNIKIEELLINFKNS